MCKTYLFSKDFHLLPLSYYLKIRVFPLVKIIQAHPNNFEKHKEKKREKEVPIAAPPKVNDNRYFSIFSYSVLSSFKQVCDRPMPSVCEFPSSFM